jgi:hypothetical protein
MSGTLNPSTPKVVLRNSYYGSYSFTTPNGGSYTAALYGQAGKNFTVTNDGYIGNSGSTPNDVGLLLGAQGVVTNNGHIYGGDGVRLLGEKSGEVVNNGTAGYIIGYAKSGIAISDGTGTVSNGGVVIGYEGGVYLGLGGTVRNLATGTIIGNGSYNSSYGVKVTGLAGTVINDGYISATAGGVILSAGGSVANTGTIIAATGVYVGGPRNATVTNKGEIYASLNGIIMFDEGKVFNAGLITASINGIEEFGGGSAATVDNTGTIIAGTILGDNGILLINLGTVLNSGTIYGYNGVHAGYGSRATNSGYIIANNAGIYGAADVTVLNTGMITATNDGILIGANGTVINAGTIITYGTPSAGILAGGPGDVVNNELKGDVSGIQEGIWLKSVGTVINAGTVQGGLSGVLAAYGAVTNAKTGYIQGYNGVRGESVGQLTLNNAGVIAGVKDGVVLEGGGTVTDTGTISGGQYAIYFDANASNRLIINATAALIGSVNGGGGVLELAAGVKGGTLNLGGGQFSNFDTIQIDAKAVWDLGGSFTETAGLSFINNGVIKFGPADSATIDGAISGTGAIDVSKNPLALNGAVSAGQTLAFSGTGETLQLGDAGAFNGTVQKFLLGDTIDLTGVSLNQITGTHFSAGVLTLYEGGGSYKLTFAAPAAFGKDHFALFADGTGTGITLSNAPVTTAAPAAARVGLVNDVTARSPWMSFATAVTL